MTRSGSRLDFAAEELAALEARGRRRGRRVIGDRDGREVTVEGRRLVNFSSNDYLGLATDPRLAAAASAAMGARGVGAGASRLITGNVDVAATLESELARWFEAPAACLFNSGYAANTGLLPVLAGAGDLLVSDELNHASIIDGCRLSRAEVRIYRHGDLGSLAQALDGWRGRRAVVVTESVFSMDGDVAPLAEIRALTAARDALMVVDDAHAIGALGAQGRGLAWSAGADVVVGTLGKAFGSAGAFVLATPALVDLLWNRARPLVFSTGLPVPALAAALEALDLVASPEGEDRRVRLAASMAQAAAALSRPVSSPIIPILVGDDRRAMECTAALIERGLLVQGIRPPTVPEGTARLRLSLSAAHTPDDVSRVLSALADLRARGWLQPG